MQKQNLIVLILMAHQLLKVTIEPFRKNKLEFLFHPASPNKDFKVLFTSQSLLNGKGQQFSLDNFFISFNNLTSVYFLFYADISKTGTVKTKGASSIENSVKFAKSNQQKTKPPDSPTKNRSKTPIKSLKITLKL